MLLHKEPPTQKTTHEFSTFAPLNFNPMNGHFFQNISAKQRKIIIIASSFLIIALTVIYLLVPIFAKQVIERKIAHIEQKRQVNIDFDQLHIAHFSIFGIFDIHLKNLSIQDQKSKIPFLQSDQLRAKVQVWKGVKRTLILKDLEVGLMSIHAIKQNGRCNYAFLKSKSEGFSDGHNYQKSINNLLGRMSDFYPTNMEISQISIVTDFDSSHVHYGITDLGIRNGKGAGKAVIQEHGSSQESWRLTCAYDKKKHQYSGSLVRDGGISTLGAIPFLRIFEELDVKLHDVQGKFSILKSDKKHTECTLSGSIHGLQCQHRYLADVPVRIDSVGADLDISVLAKSIILDSSSTIKLNRAALHPYIRFNNDHSQQILFRIREQDRNAEPLFASLPSDLFQVLPDMKFAGRMDFNCLFDCDFGNLDSLRFDFNLINKQRSLHITEGLGEITRFNDSFEYTFYDHGEPIRTLIVGPENPYFCPSYAIPDILKQAILASEDGAFFVHNGFSKSAMRQAIVDDLKAGKMRRGGSTITMQLVKNLFLSRKKVLTRKFEEMLLVWMIEDQHLISKDRMFEIYVNIIEWAPGIIGIGEAAEFYFHKRPNELTMPECIYLATLIRAPKHYAGTLNPDGTLTDVKRSELEFVADRMVIREFMTEGQRATFDANIRTVLRREASE